MTTNPPPTAQPLEPRLLLAAQQVADLFTPPADSYPAGVTDVGGTAFFAAANGGVGRELYRSDGTPAGTVLVKDVNPGPDGSDPSSLINVNGTLFFIATLAPGRKELWKSDGTGAGTVRVSDNVNLYIPTYSGGDARMEVFRGEVYFRGYDTAAGVEVWKSDGTDDGTVRLKDINPGLADSRPAYFEPLDDVLLFSADDGVSGLEVWRTDGTEAGTARVAEVAPGDTGFQYDLTRSGEFVYFGNNSSRGFSELWRTDGTAPGTVLLTTQTVNGPGINDLTDVNGTLYFAEYSIGNQLWKSDGTPGGTRLVRDFTDYEGFYAYAESLTNVNETLFFRLITNRPLGSELWRSDGTAAGTVRLDTFPAPPTSAEFIDKLVPVADRLYFSAFTLDAGRELWKSDGTPGGATLVRDIQPGPASSNAAPLAAAGGRLFLSARTDSTGVEPWTSDGTAAGTQLAADVNPGTADANPHDLADVNGTLFFTTDRSDTGTVIYKTDPALGGVVPVWDGDDSLGAMAGPLSHPAGRPLARDLEGSGGRLFFAVYDLGWGADLWTSDGTPQGTARVDLPLGEVQFITDLNGAGTVLLAARGVGGSAPGAGQELWRSDGTAAGTVLVKDISPGPQADSFPRYLTNVNGTVFFAADDGTHGRELWKSDGTEAGTMLVKDLVPGAGSSDPWGLVAVNRLLFFRVALPGGGTELWKSDGTEAGTVGVAALPPTPPPARGYPYERDWRRGAGLGDTLLFAAGDPAGADGAGVELWSSDGTEAGTLRLKDIEPGPLGSEPQWFEAFDGTLYFGAYDSTAGRELWATDGTAGGTARVQDIYPGVGSSDPAWLEVSGGALWFGATSPVGGNELWKFSQDPAPTGARVVGRHVFYNNSSFDGDSAAANADDDGAIATDKNALLAGQDRLPGFDNVTSYTRGINGVIIDVANLPVIDAILDAGDFDFGGGPAPVSVTVRPGAGAGGSDRVTLVWRDYNPRDTSPLPQAVANGWLTVTVKANGHTGLSQPDVFSFGNLIGETGDAFSRFRVSVNDALQTRRNFFSAAPVTSRYDFNRDGRVGVTDFAISRSNLGRNLAGPTVPIGPQTPIAPAAPPRDHEDDGVWQRLAV